MKQHTPAKHSFITRFSTELALHKLKTDARYLTAVSFYRSFVTLLLDSFLKVRQNRAKIASDVLRFEKHVK